MKPTRARATTLIGWQTLLADLSLILFMVTAAAMAAKPDHPAGAKQAGRPAPNAAVGAPLAMWRAGGSQTLRQWLAGEQSDVRQQLTITAHYRLGEAAPALLAVQELVGQASAMGKSARVIVTPAGTGTGEEILASLAYDRAPESGLAQDLLIN